MLRRRLLPVGAAVLALILGAAAPADAFDAHGSARQVSVTGLAPGTRVTLLKPSGRKKAGKRADAQGGLLFRGVKPAAGYRVRPRGGAASGPLTVFSNRAAPPSAAVYNQALPSSGYGYLTTRDGTPLAI